MKIKVEEVPDLPEEEILIRCKEHSKRVDDIISTLKLYDRTINVRKDGRNYLLNLNQIFYFESVDDKVFCYTEKEVFETNIKLYEIENAYLDTNFLRINKYMIIDVSKIKSFKAQLNGRMEAVLNNEEKVEISRNYVPALKIKLGGIKK